MACDISRLPTLFRDVDPELQGYVLSFWPCQVDTHFFVVPMSQDRQTERNGLGNVCKVIAIALEISFEFREYQVVRIQRE